MHQTLLIRAAGVSLCLIGLATVSFSQPSPSPTPTPSPTPLKIVYTGKLLGYFRMPDLQPLTDFTCPSTPSPPSAPSAKSRAAAEFLAVRDKAENKDSILLGAGDNFAPQLEARVFNPVPDPKSGKYISPNKEHYYWYGAKWVRPEDLLPADQKKLRSQVASGTTTVPVDNVGCFLTAARYTAIVPGRHDFYFGAERLRHLARFMAGCCQPSYHDCPNAWTNT